MKKPDDGQLLKLLDVPGITITGKARSVTVPDGDQLMGSLMFMLNFNIHNSDSVFTSTDPLPVTSDYIYRFRYRPITLSISQLHEGYLLKPEDWILQAVAGNNMSFNYPTGNNITVKLTGNTLTFTPMNTNIFWINPGPNGWGMSFGYTSVFQVISE
ncbi:hypothetical protein FMM01_02185 [Schleiferilactobacillus harbinensis]|uniref:hypothetical protein n=1 Tax=Schleiferilactobacillus harbinensis TaxID=304207 RepID=UPI00123BBDE8|nr:hypothetical protein [Schleiferilactobacillus harbinensis]QEU46220.1 hypothetical protein FMM01_02185 [Schleiferilactobacillus harbinensis]